MNTKIDAATLNAIVARAHHERAEAIGRAAGTVYLAIKHLFVH